MIAANALRATVGYGYNTWLPLTWMALVVTFAVVVAFAFESDDFSWFWARGQE